MAAAGAAVVLTRDDGPDVGLDTVSASGHAVPQVDGSDGDPVELTRREAPGAEAVGYPLGGPRQVFTGRDLIGWEAIGDGWVPTYRTRC